MARARDSRPHRPNQPPRQLPLGAEPAWPPDQTADELMELWDATGPNDDNTGDTVDRFNSVIREGPGFLLSPDDGWVNPEISLVLWRHRDEQTTPRSALVPDGQLGVIDFTVRASLDQDELPQLELRVVDDDTGEPVPCHGPDEYFNVPGEVELGAAAEVDPGWYRWELRAPAGPVNVLGTRVFVNAARAF